MTTGIGRRPVRAWVEQILGMPVSVHVRADHPKRTDIDAAVSTVFGHLREVDAVFSTWRSDSEVMRIRTGDLDAADAHPWFHEVKELCNDATTKTSGLFTTDLVGPNGTRGWDPTGLVKGWAVAQAALHLREIDRIAFSINAGGDIECGLGIDSADLAQPWRIGIEDPRDRSVVARVVEVSDGAVATSSAAARGNHIIDPRTGSPISRSGSATVYGPDLTTADVWATATFIDPGALDRHPDSARYRSIYLPGADVVDGRVQRS